ncbi:MAG: hypothetical protein J0H50_03800 [Xanthomonadales bacterium]|nr:hypothetical protein [Xanthomonadales bacterium]
MPSWLPPPGTLAKGIAMEQKTYFVRGVLNGRRQPDENFTSELHARRRAAHLGTSYDSVVVDLDRSRPWADWWAAVRSRLRGRGPGHG